MPSQVIMDLNNLTEPEKILILQVIQRDDELRQQYEQKINKLRGEIKQIRLNSVIRSEDGDPDKRCPRCKVEFGWLFNRGSNCPKCQQKVCANCQQQLEQSWICVLCMKQRQLTEMSGEWFYAKFRHSKRSRKTNHPILGSEIVKSSIRRKDQVANNNYQDRGSVNMVNDEVKRRVWSNSQANVQHSDSHGSDSTSSTPTKKTNYTQAAFPKDSDKLMLLDLLGGPSINRNLGGPGPTRPQQDLIVRKITTRRLSDSSSGAESGPSSPQCSHRTESEFGHSDSMRSSLRSNSALSSDGRITLVTETGSVISGISTAPPSMFEGQEGCVDGEDEGRDRVVKSGSKSSEDSAIENPSYSSPVDGRAHANLIASVPLSRKIDPDSPSDFHHSDTSLPDSVVGQNGVPSVGTREHSRTTGRMTGTPTAHDDRFETTSSTGSPRSAKVRTAISTDYMKTSSPIFNHRDNAEDSTTPGGATQSDRQSISTMSSRTLSIPSVTVTNDELGQSGQEDDLDQLDDLVAAHSQGRFSAVSKKRAKHLSNFSVSTESMASVYSSAGEMYNSKITVTGEVQVVLQYNYKTTTLEILVKQCHGLAMADVKKKRSDPYVKTYLLPDRTKSGKRKTSVRKRNLNPVFEEKIKYEISKSELESRELWLTVWHNDRFGRNDFLGEVRVPFDYYEFKDPAPKWYPLQPPKDMSTSSLTYKGDLDLSLKFITAEHVSSTRKVKSKMGNNGELHIVVKQARHLTAVRANGSSDPFCKAMLLPITNGKQSKQKSPVVKRSCNPQWNHTFVFEDVRFEELKHVCLELSVWDHDRFTSNDFLGGARLGLGAGKSFGKDAEWNDARGEEITLWQSMIDRPNQWIEGTLLLRTSLTHR